MASDLNGTKHAQKRRLGKTDVFVSRLGYGGTALAGPSAPPTEAVISAAFDQGIRYFDTSPFYGSGLSEHRLGTALRTVPRGDYVLSTKVGRIFSPDLDAEGCAEAGKLPFKFEFDYSRPGTIRSFEDSLQRLGLARIDFLIIHDVSHRWHGDGFVSALARATTEALPALIELKEAGLIGAIGLGTNDLLAAVPMAAHGGLDCVMIAREYNLLNHRDLLADLAPICAEKGISLLCAAPYASGILATGLTEGATYMYAPPDTGMRQKVMTIQAVCKDFGVPLPAAALQFADLNPLVASVVAGLRNQSELFAAIEAFNHPIPPDFWSRLKDLGLIHTDAPTQKEAA
ncbi:MAG: aldo/keto reductase [Pseudomonadota bacterium]